MIVPTKRFWVLVAMGIPVAILGLVRPGLEWLAVPYNLLLAAAFFTTGFAARRWDILRLERRFDPILSVRVPNPVRLILHNDSNEPLSVWVRDEPPLAAAATVHEWRVTLNPESSQTLLYTITPEERGEDRFLGTFVRWPAPMGLCEIQKKFEVDEELRIYPNVAQIREFEILKQRGRLDLLGVRRSRRRGLGTEFESLRDYNEDDYRIIDWKASARRDRLVVRNYEQERNQAVIVCFDIGRQMLSEVDGVRKIDYALDSGLMLMHAAERSGDMVGLLVYNDILHRWIAPKRGRAQVAALLDTIHRLQAEPVQTDHHRAAAALTTRWKRRSLVVVFTDADNEDDARRLAASLSAIRRRHLVMIVRVRDPRVRELMHAPLTGEREIYRRASAQLLEEGRREAENILQSAGFDSVEAEPQELTAKLVSAYLTIKEMNRI